MSDSRLAKLVIHSYKDREFNTEDKASRFTVPINPETFTKNYKVELDTREGQGSSGSEPVYKSTRPEELKLDFVLDGTATMEGYVEELKNLSVREQLDKFLKCAYNFDGDMHRPRFLIVHWGEDVKFPCVLKNLDLNHSLFNPDGSPLRVKISATFLSHLTPQSRAARDRLQSPDLSHYRQVEAGDRLDWLIYEIYNDPNYLLQIGKVNRLTSLRKLPQGKNLYFPPFEKDQNKQAS